MEGLPYSKLSPKHPVLKEARSKAAHPASTGGTRKIRGLTGRGEGSTVLVFTVNPARARQEPPRTSRCAIGWGSDESTARTERRPRVGGRYAGTSAEEPDSADHGLSLDDTNQLQNSSIDGGTLEYSRELRRSGSVWPTRAFRTAARRLGPAVAATISPARARRTGWHPAQRTAAGRSPKAARRGRTV